MKVDMSVTAWTRRVLVAAGLAMAAVGLDNLAGNIEGAFWGFTIRWLAIGLFVALPAALAVGALIGRVVPAVARPVVQGACFATAMLTAIAWPAITGHGRQSDLRSALPRNYASGLLLVLALVWATAGVFIVARVVRGRTGKESRS